MEPATGLAAAIEAITAVVTGCVTWIGSYMGAIMNPSNSLLLIMFSLPLVGMGIGALKRLADR